MVLHMFTKDDVIEILSYTKKLDLPLEKNSIYVLWKVCIQMVNWSTTCLNLFCETLGYYVFFLIVFYSTTLYVTKMTTHYCWVHYKNTYFYCSHLFKFMTIDLQKNRKLWKHVIVRVSTTLSKGHIINN
jgi:hypothetical protein